MKENFEGGLTSLKEKDFEKARDSFLAITEEKPENADAHLGLSYAYAGLGNIADAEKHLKAALGLFEAQRKFSEAYITAKGLLEMKPKVIKYTFDLLRVYLKLNFLKAFGELLMTTMEDEGIAEDVLLENLSSLAHFIKESEIKEALNLKKTGPKEEEKLNPFENLELANLLFEIGSTDEAKTEYYKTARAFLSRELKDKAQELFVKIKELYPDEKELEALKVEIDEYGIKKESKDPAARRERLAAITARFENENEARVRYSVAVILKEYGRYDQATEELEVLFQLPKSPEKIKAYVLLSQMYLDSKDSTAAIGVLKDAIARGEFEGDELVPIEYKLGTLYEKAKQYDEALRIFQIALDKDNEYLDIIDRVKNVKELIKKQEEEAERAVEEAEREAEAIADAEEAGIEKIVKVEEPEQAEPKKKKVVEKVAVQEEKPTMQERILYI